MDFDISKLVLNNQYVLRFLEIIATDMKQKIQFHYLINSFILTKRTELKLFITSIAVLEGKTIDSVKYIFCKDEYLLNLNYEFLLHDYLTDVITFDLSNHKGIVTGEIYISIERVKDNARYLKETFKHELHRVMFHGLLHLCGFKDKTEEETLLMRRKEDLYLNKYFIL